MTTINLPSDQREALAGLLATKDVDILREMLGLVYSAAIEAQFEQHVGADHYERSDERRDVRNGTRTRGLNTRAGDLDLVIPRARRSNFQPTVIERFRRSERALIAVIQEAFVAGISTRDMEKVLETMGVERLSKSQISELCTELDTKAEAFRSRPLTGKYPYLWLDALYEKVRIDDRVISNAVVIAYGVNLQGEREIIGIDIVDTESAASWTGFLRSLRKRGPDIDVKLVISDAHEGLKTAIKTVMHGASWQRCKVHFYRNILARVPQSRKSEVVTALRSIFAQVSTPSAKRASAEFVATFSTTLGKAVEVFESGIDEALTFLAFPLEHHRKIATSNPIEHVNREIRRRTRSIGIFPSTASALRIITMILIEQHEDWMSGRKYMSPESLELVATM